GIALLNGDPAQFEQAWSAWRAPGTGGGTVVGSDDDLGGPLEENGTYLFAVQAMDRCGGVTDEFSGEVNARQFDVHTILPSLTVFEPLLGACTFWGIGGRPPAVPIAPRATYRFEWRAGQTYPWFDPIEYRCGWDLQNLDDPSEWDCPFNPWAVWTWPRTVLSGVHVFYVEARDDAGSITQARIELETIPFPMDRDLLWIDDWTLGAPTPDMMLPGEEQHDEFWIGMCSLASGFDPARDVLEADALYPGQPVPIAALAHYRNVIWTYGQYDDAAWRSTVRFTPPDQVGSPALFRPNALRLFFAAGGSALTSGRSDRNGSALAATFPEPPLMPVDVVREISPGDDEAGLRSMPYEEYHVTVIDKVAADFRTDMPGGVFRSLDRDAMRRAELVGISNDLPATLELRSEITAPGMYWDPRERGFWFVEVYDPAYWMQYRGLLSHECFRPIYLMRARSTLSPLDRQAVAIWTRTPFCGQDPGNPSDFLWGAHFGFPLWYIEPEQSEAIVRFIFELWEI
ncbi:MAG: hypothetical protein PHQ19_09980, partial [Candidatus Krumholzibacteria bacterium]|nr:hypothetical protein [Candidatus Krumholzibacteria bacterium]